MKVLDNLKVRFKALTASPGALQAFREMGAGFFGFTRFSQYVNGAYNEVQAASYGHIYGTQENVRIVVDAVARHATKRTLKCYDNLGPGKTEEDPDFEAAETLDQPNDFQTSRQLLSTYILDKLIYEDAFLWDMGPVENARRFLIRVPPPAMGVSTDNSLRPTGYFIRFNNGQTLPLQTHEVIHWGGYNPGHNRLAISKLETLRVMLTENAVRKAHLIDMLRGGLIKGGIVTRPFDAPEWSPKARERFEKQFAGRLRGVAKGQIAMLEDGMDFKEAGITPQQAELLESRQFDLALTANIFGVNPGLFQSQGNLAQAREQMEEDVVESLVNDLADVFTLQLIRNIYGDQTHYFQFTRSEITDLATLFEAGSKATGGSVLTQNEFRSDYMNKPPLPGGDTLITHPGAQEGGLPEKPGSESRGTDPLPDEDLGAEATVKGLEALVNEAIQTKASADIQKKAEEQQEAHFKTKAEAEHIAVLSRHLRRMKAAHKDGNDPASAMSRWDRELADDLREVAADVVREKGVTVAGDLGGPFDMVQVNNYLNADAEIAAKAINRATYNAVAMGRAKGSNLESVYESRILNLNRVASDRVTHLTSFATLEAARQVGG